MRHRAIYESYLKTYTDRDYRHTTLVRHKGTVIAFAMDERRRISYAVLELDGPSPKAIDARNWPANPSELRFPREIAQVGFGLIGPITFPLVRRGGQPAGDVPLLPSEVDPFLSSTARFTAAAPFQVLSDEKHVYVFRQAIGADHPDMLFAESADGARSPTRAGVPFRS